MKRHLVAGALNLATILLLSTTPIAQGATDGVQVRAMSPGGVAQEQYERDVDRVALSSQNRSIRTLKMLLRKYAGTHQEPVLLSKLAELQSQKTSILFRIAHGPVTLKGKKGALNLNAYKQSLKQTISTLNLLIAKYPHYQDIASAYFSRGKAYEDLDNRPAASKDYLFLVHHFPEAEQTSSAYMSLAQFAIDANNHPLAITYLMPLEKRPEDPEYPFALYKLAWSYYNLKDIPNALHYAEQQIAYYNDRDSKDVSSQDSDDNLASDTALKKNTLYDVPLFYFEGVKQKNSDYTVEKAMDYFRKLDHGPAFGHMAIRFAKLLRSRDMGKELVYWRNQMLKEEWQRPEALDVLILTYGYQQNQRDFPALIETARDLADLYKKVGPKKILKYPNLADAQKMILDTAEHLQQVIVKNKDTEQAKQLSVTLATLYNAFTQIVVETDPRIPQVHYNLAETLFTIQDYDGATTHYRWVVDHMDKIPPIVLKTVGDAPIKAIGARYEVLRQKKLIPTKLTASALPKADSTPPKLDPLLESWIGWIDTLGEKLARHAGKTRHSQKANADNDPYKSWDNFNFEANRAIYAQGDPRRAVKRLEEFAKARPQSSFGIPSASLVLDSYIAGSDWDKVYSLATDFKKLAPWKHSAFGDKLYEVAADSLYKKLELKYQAKDYVHTLEDADEFMKEYKKSARYGDCLNLAGATALALGQKNRAMNYLSKLITSDKDPVHVSKALLARASIQEERYQFAPAESDYLAYLNMVQNGAFKDAKKKPDDSKLDDLRRKALALSWLAGVNSDLQNTLKDKAVCTKSVESECDKYQAISAIQDSALNPPDKQTTISVFNRFRKMSSSEARTLWAIYVLQGSKHLAFRDRNLTLRTIGSGYKDLDPLTKYAVVPYLTSAIPATFELNRVAMSDVAPLRANERYITHRVDSIHELENAVRKIMDLPWARIRASTLNVLASVYHDLSKGLADLPPPKNLNDSELASYQETIRKLSLPFDDKAQDIRSKAFEIASRFAVEDDTMQSIVEPFFAENPSQARNIKSLADLSKKDVVIPKGLHFVELGPDYLPYIKEAGDLAFYAAVKKAKAEKEQEPSRNPLEKLVLNEWSGSLKSHNWPQVAFYLQEAKDKKLFPPSEMGLIESVSLASIGARGEALAELQDTRKIVDPKIEPVVTLTLAQSFKRSYESGKAKALFTEFIPPPPKVVALSDEKPASNAHDKAQRSQRAPAGLKRR